MSGLSLHEAMLLEHLMAKHLAASQSSLTENDPAAAGTSELAYELAVQEASIAGMNLPTYAAALQEQHAVELAHFEALAQMEAAHAEAAAAGMDLATYAAALEEDRAIESAEAEAQAELEAAAHAEAAAAGMDLASYAAALEEQRANKSAEAEAAAAGMDLGTYAAVLKEQYGAESAALEVLAELESAAHAEAAAAGMDLATYAAALEQQHGAELAHFEALAQAEAAAQSGQAPIQVDDPVQLQQLAEREAAAAGMDLESYQAALRAEVTAQHEAELAILEELAYLEGMALHEAETAAHQAALSGLTPEEFAYLQQQCRPDQVRGGT